MSIFSIRDCSRTFYILLYLKRNNPRVGRRIKQEKKLWHSERLFDLGGYTEWCLVRRGRDIPGISWQAVCLLGLSRLQPQPAAPSLKRDCFARGCLLPSTAGDWLPHPRIILGRQVCIWMSLMRSATTLIHNAPLYLSMDINVSLLCQLFDATRELLKAVSTFWSG